MSSSSDQPTTSDLAAVEAAAWFAKRTSGFSAGDSGDFDAWLSAHSTNRTAYNAAEDIWSELDAVVGRPDSATQVKSRAAPSTLRRAPAWAAALAVCVALLTLTVFLARPAAETLETGIGVQRTAKLDDGTVVTLNTATRLSIRYDEEERAVRFDRGEALFEVAHDASRPFVVSVENHRVTALGTSFAVRSDAKGAWVALIEGSVRVADSTGGATILRPGERLALSEGTSRLDRPELGSLTAWRHGELAFDQTPLSEAIFEINRYTDRPIVLDAPEIRARRLTGTFRVNRSEEFAESIATLYGLRIEEQADSIALRRAR